MQHGRWKAAWMRHSAAALGYGVAYVLLRDVTISHWIPLAALRILCLLLVPARYWPALVVGEFVPLGAFSLTCLEQYGWAWVLVSSVPPIGLAMPAAYWLRKRLPGPGRSTAVYMGPLLLCAFVFSVFVSARGMLKYVIGPILPQDVVPYDALAGQYFLGSYLAIVAFVPLCLVVYEALGPKLDVRKLVPPPTLLAGCVLMLAVAGSMVWYGTWTASVQHREAVQLAMFVLVALFAMWKGWRGAAFAGAVASVSILAIMPEKRDATTLTAQLLVAFTVTTLLLLGAAISSLRRALTDSWKIIQLARQEQYLDEIRNRYNAQELEQVYAGLHVAHSRLLHRLRFFLPDGEGKAYREQLGAARQRVYRIADSLSPREWQRIGHPNTLWTGPLAEVLEEAGVAFDVDLSDALNQFAPDANLALYRLGCETITYVLTHYPTDRIDVAITTLPLPNGYLQAELWVESSGRPVKPPARQQLLTGLGAAGLSEDDMRNRARLYEGDLRIDAQRQRVVVSIKDRSVRVTD